MNTEMNNRNENAFIRSLFSKHCPSKLSHVTARHYNDLRVKGRRRIFKTPQHSGVAMVWVRVLKELQDTVYRNRWQLWESPDMLEVGIKCYQER